MSGSIHWRVDHLGTHDVTVGIGSDTTVGEVAAALAAVVSPAGLPPGPVGDTGHALTICSAGAALDPGGVAHETAPRSGGTISLAPPSGGVPAAGGLDAPAVLRSGTSSLRLRYGRNAVAAGVAVQVGRDIRVVARGADPVMLDGVRVHDEAIVPDGGLLRLGDWAATVQVLGDLRPPPATGPWRTHAPRRGPWPLHEDVRVELPSPPEPGRLPGIPWLSMAVPLAMAVGIWAASGSLLWSGFMAISVGYVVAAALEARHEARLEQRFRSERFRRELDRAAARLDRLEQEEHERDQLRHPSGSELLAWLYPVGQRVWERDASHPAPLTVRLGTAELPADALVEPPSTDLHDELEPLLRRHRLHRRAVVVDLAATGGLAIVGDPGPALRLLDALLLQLAVLVAPDVVQIRGRPPDAGPTHWTDWLPHRRGAGSVAVEVTGPSGQDTAPMGGSVQLWSGSTTSGLPSSVRAVLHLHPHAPAELCIGHGPPTEVDLELGDAGSAEEAARLLSGLVLDQVHLPTPATLRGIGLPLDPDDLLRRWAPGGSWADRRALNAPLGVGDGGGVVHVDLMADGPHALVAGTTGAGKSELLRTWMAGLAALHPPVRLHLLLVDYKGGTSFGPLSRLPHCAGLVTDLTPQRAQRALAGLRAELRRRERLVEGAGVSDVVGMAHDDAPASLVVVIDEFATLLDEVPEFVEGVLDVARRGRSLGIHLIMATQRPSGVISDAIRANTSLRMALRLPDAEDSRDVLGAPDASTLRRDQPGRALVRFAHDRLRAVQVAYSGAAGAGGGPSVPIHPLGHPAPPTAGGDDDAPGPSELELLVQACRQAATDAGAVAANPPWCEPLPAVLRLSHGSSSEAGSGVVVLGQVDLPEHQRRGPLGLDLRRGGGVLAVGAAGSGTSTTLLTLAAASHALGWQVAAIDAGGGLGPLGPVPAGDHERVHRLLRRLQGRNDGPPMLLLIDDLAAFELAQRPVNRGEALDLLTQLATAAPTRRLALAVSARRRGDVPPELLHALGERLVHRCHDRDAASGWDAPEWLADPQLPPGRVAHRGRVAQVGLWKGPLPAARAPRRLPPEVVLDELPVPETAGDGAGRRAGQPLGAVRSESTAPPLVVPIGVEADTLGPATVDLSVHHLLITGGPGSGKSTALATLRAAASRRGLTTIVPSEPGELGSLLLDHPAEEARPVLVLLDDAEDWCAEPTADALLEEVLLAARARPLRLAIAGEPGALWRNGGAALERVRSGRSGVILGDAAHEHEMLLHTQLPRRDDLPLSAGRGWLLHRGAPTLVQIARS
jgi:S-DNA-T family DNA segregation ATPase FtsK/SpoIIIE